MVTTFVFTDMQGSTATNERLGDRRWFPILRAHNAISRRQIAAHGGFEVKSQGDGFMVVFSSAGSALACALEMQRDFAAYSEHHPDGPLRVRIGVHVGEAIREGNDFLGLNVTRAARIAAHADGAEILVSSVARELGDGVGAFRFDPGRALELRGLSGTYRVFGLRWGSA
jgi:class 3 adenylate cyclase